MPLLLSARFSGVWGGVPFLSENEFQWYLLKSCPVRSIHLTHQGDNMFGGGMQMGGGGGGGFGGGSGMQQQPQQQQQQFSGQQGGSQQALVPYGSSSQGGEADADSTASSHTI